MTVCLLAPFRNSAARIPGYFILVRRFKDLTGWEVRVVAGEGDSTDRTREVLLEQSMLQRIPLDLLQVDHGGPVFGSVEDPLRFKQLSLVQNALFNAVRPTDDVAVYLEHDVVWEPAMLQSLVNYAKNSGVVVAPLVYAEDQKRDPSKPRRFYDTWAFRDLEGKRYPPHFEIEDPNPWEASSVGTCFAMPASFAENIYCAGDESLVSLCRDLRFFERKIFVHPKLSLYHPDH